MNDQNPGTPKRGIGRKLLVWCLVLLAMVAVAVGDVEPVPAVESQTVKADQPAPSVIAGKVTGDRIESITFQKDTRIRDALRFLAAKYKKNIVPSPKVDGVLAFTSLYNVTFEEAMDAIMGMNLAYERKGQLIKVYTKQEYQKVMEDKSRMVTRVFTLHYISSAEASKLVAPVLSSVGTVTGSSPTVTGIPTGQSITSTQGQGGDNIATHDTLVVFDYPENVEKAAEIVERLDVRPKQVLVEAAILSVTLTEDTQFGIDWQTLKGAVTSLSGITSGASDFFKSAGTSQVDKTGGMTIGLAFGDIGAFIRAVEEVTDVTVLAKPKILAVNKQLGQVYIGQKLGYRNGDVITDGGATQEGSVEFLDTGTKLAFRPYIGDDGYIRMDIHPKDSTGSLGADNVPQETSAELVTNILVKDGQTIVIGGLFRNKMTTKKTQVPVLGDIPIVGGLFRGNADKVERQEVMVLLTPHIVDEPEQTEGEARAEDISRKEYAAEEQLQWISKDRIAQKLYTKALRCYLDGDYDLALKEVETSLRIYPTNLEALRLKDRILRESDPDQAETTDRVILRNMDEQEAWNWRKRQ